MKITIQGRNLKLTPDLKDYVEQKIGKLEKYISNFSDVKCEVELILDKVHHSGKINQVQATIFLPNHIVRASEGASEMHEAIDLVYEKLENQLLKLKEKQGNWKRKVSLRFLASPFVRLRKRLRR